MKKWEKHFKTRELFLAWAAGFFDGEGSVVVSSTKRNAAPGREYSFRLSCAIAQINAYPLELIHEEFGGSLSSTNLHQSWRQTKRRIPTLNILGLKAVNFLNEIHPYCIQKKDEVALAKTWLLKFEAGTNGGRRTKLTDDEYNARLAVRDGLRGLRAAKKAEGRFECLSI